MIAVVGGSGLLGQHVVEQLRAGDQQVRAVVRDVDRARLALGWDVEIVTADVLRPATLGPALAGASAVVSAMHGFLGGRGAGPREVDDAGNANLVRAAQSAGADFVLVSIIGATAGSALELFRAKAAAEQHVRDSGVPWTIVRAAAFIETWLQVLEQSAGKSGRPLVFGRGETPIPFVSAVDVASVVSAAAIDRRMRGSVLEVSGEPVTMNELARQMKTARGWETGPRHVPRAMLRSAALLARPIRPAFARQNVTALAMDTTAPGLGRPSSPLGVPLRTVADVLQTERSGL